MWTPFNSNTCPVDGATRVDIRCRDGFEISHSRADYPDWSRTGRKDEIVAYRVQS